MCSLQNVNNQPTSSIPGGILDNLESGLTFQIVETVDSLMVNSYVSSGWLASQADKVKQLSSNFLLQHGLQSAVLHVLCVSVRVLS
eukprot:SAG31_NODE_2774_length_5106_cov_5.381748_1_plen_86_part_00